jgi:nucleotidyltransferase/DNA polymerase involved in DNA repair
LRRHGIVAFSSNYALYGQMSERVMTLIESMVSDSEVYSIDEIFCDLTGMAGDLTEFGRKIRAKVLKYTGIPVGVGIAHVTCRSSSAGALLSICRRKSKNSLARCRWVIRPITSPVMISNAAYRLAVPWRL